MSEHRRLDQLMVERGLAESRERSQRLVLAGKVRVDGAPADKPGRRVAADVEIAVTAPERYVGRGGEKLEAALDAFGLDVRNRICLDVGASTGGFTDCLLQRGAAGVYAVDVGCGQLHWKLRRDPRVRAMEKVNARYLRAGDFPERPFCAVVDVAFISLKKILPAVKDVICAGGWIVALIKPQFEARRSEVRRGGVVRDPAVHVRVVEELRRFGGEELGLKSGGVCASPLKGPAGNSEFLAYWSKP